MAPSQAEALVQKDGKLNKRLIDVPKPTEHQLLVKVAYAAQNPTDVMSLDMNRFGDGSVLGCDFVGTVEQVGSAVQRYQPGETIAGLIQGGATKGVGAYSQYTIAEDNISFPLPDKITPSQGATIPLAAGTAWLAFFSKDCLNIPREGSDETVLIWGGSSSVGLYAIQLAKLCNLTVITTCGPHNHEDAKALGAKHVFDYKDPDVANKIRAVAPGLRYVFDTIGNEVSSVTASQAINEKGGTLCTVRPGRQFTENVTKQTKTTDVSVWNSFYKEHRYGDIVYPASEGDHKLAAELFAKMPEWLVEGKLKPNNARLYVDGLDDVPRGFQEYRDGRISNYKIVYKILHIMRSSS